MTALPRLFARLAAAALAAAAILTPLTLNAGTMPTATAFETAPLPAPAPVVEGEFDRCDPRPWAMSGDMCLQPLGEDGPVRVVRLVGATR